MQSPVCSKSAAASNIPDGSTRINSHDYGDHRKAEVSTDDITDNYVTISQVSGTGHIYAHVPIKSIKVEG